MIGKRRLVLPVKYKQQLAQGLCLLAIMGIQLNHSAFSASRELGEHWYISGLSGQSHLQPKTSNTPYTLGDTHGLGVGFSLGYDLNRWWSLEAHAMDLGNAGINLGNIRAGEINYSSAGISLLTYLPFRSSQTIGKYQLGQREGFSLYARIGAGILDTYTDLPSQQNQNLHALLGAGIEYGWENGLAIRIEGTSYDQDARMFGVGLVKRFGQLAPSAGLPITEHPEVSFDVTTPALQSIGQTAEPPAQLPVKQAQPTTHKRRPFFELNLPIISFQQMNHHLVIHPEDEPALVKLAKALQQQPALHLMVERYQPSSPGQMHSNAATAVIQFLVTRGVNQNRLKIVAPRTSPPGSLLPANRVEFSLAR